MILGDKPLISEVVLSHCNKVVRKNEPTLTHKLLTPIF
jgi:hypothetical protein